MKLLAKRFSRSKHAEIVYIHSAILVDPEWNRLRILYRVTVSLPRPIIVGEWGAYADRTQSDELRLP